MSLPAELRPGLPTTRNFIWAIVERDFSGLSRLMPVRLSSRDDGERAFRRIRDRLAVVRSHSCICRMLAAICTARTASTATITYATKDEHYRHDPTMLRVFLEHEDHNTFLTQALDDPSVLRGDVSSLEAYQQLLIRPTSTAEALVGQRALVISQVLDKTKIARLLVLLLVVSPALGVFVGIRSHRADVGAAVSAGVFALAAVLQGLAAWFRH